MQDDHLKEKQKIFDEGMTRLAEAFGIELKLERAAVYESVLLRYSASDLKRALTDALENEAFFPAIANIRKYIEPLTDPRNPVHRTPITEW